jgi:hypothetical protein
MLKIENTEVMGWEAAIRGMRNPMNSWEKSDSRFDSYDDCGYCAHCNLRFDECPAQQIGPNDLSLMTKLRDAGTDHRKFMRMITVYLDITAPLYWWKEFDTYKVGTVANSCSTMHKIHEKEFTLDDFSIEHLSCEEFGVNGLRSTTSTDVINVVIDALNYYRRCFIEDGKSKDDWWQMIQLLPSSYNQKRTVMLNYEVLANIYKSRKNHKLDEWNTFCEWIESLPYSELIIGKTDGAK